MAISSQFIVDTSILIAHIRQKSPESILEKAQQRFGEPVTSDIVVFELEIGAQRRGRQLEFANLFPQMTAFPLSQEILLLAAKLQADLLQKNQIIGISDVFIAATGIYHDLPLLTLNTKHFQRLIGLSILPLP
jgi:tRNA(fMet)-specific endonuclease VapC